MVKKKSDNDNVPFEVALEGLESIVRKLEGSDLKLEEAIELFRSGVELAGVCRGKLTKAQQEVEKIVETANGEISLTSLEISEG